MPQSGTDNRERSLLFFRNELKSARVMRVATVGSIVEAAVIAGMCRPLADTAAL